MTGWFLALNVTPNNAYLGVLKKNIQQHWYSYPVKKVLLDDVDTGFAWHVHCAQPSCPLWESCRCAARWTFFVLKKKDVEELGQQSCSMCVHYVVATRMRLAPKYQDSISLFPIESRGSHSDGNVRQAWFHLRVYTWFNFRRVLSPDVIVC